MTAAGWSRRRRVRSRSRRYNPLAFVPSPEVHTALAVRLRTCIFALAVATWLAAVAAPSDAAQASAWTRVVLDGHMVPVSFNDGDSFRIHAGPFAGSQCRLSGFNTLESFGPAHQWGAWHPYELFVLAKLATLHARRGTWHCTTDGRRDGYGRLLVDCPDLAVSQISHGFAHAMQVDDTPARPEYIRAMREAIEARRGIWAHGVPDYVMTSLHSASEDPSRPWHYNRLVSTRDGHSESMQHRDTYEECQWVCNDEIRVDVPAITAAARRMREDPTFAAIVAPLANVHLIEAASRFVRRGELPAWIGEPARAALEDRLRRERESGLLGGTRTERGACMLYVEFARRYGAGRASCLRGHGTLPPGLAADRGHGSR